MSQSQLIRRQTKPEDALGQHGTLVDKRYRITGCSEEALPPSNSFVNEYVQPAGGNCNTGLSTNVIGSRFFITSGKQKSPEQRARGIPTSNLNNMEL